MYAQLLITLGPNLEGELTAIFYEAPCKEHLPTADTTPHCAEPDNKTEPTMLEYVRTDALEKLGGYIHFLAIE